MAAPDATALLARLVARPSIAGGGNGELIADVATVLDEAGADVRVHDGTRPGTHVLHAVLGPADAPGGVLLAAHGDVVDVAGQTWTSRPLRPARRRRPAPRTRGRRHEGLHRRDAGRHRAIRPVVTERAAARGDLARRGARLRGHRAAARRARGGGIAAPLAGVVVGEPTELRVVDRHKGKAAIDITLHGRAAHSATPSAGVNAVRAAAHLIVALEDLERQLATEASDAVVLDAARHDRHRPDRRRRRAQHRARPLHAAGRGARAAGAAARRDRRADRRRRRRRRRAPRRRLPAAHADRGG